MEFNDIIKKKESNEQLTKKELEYSINNYINEKISDEDMTKLLQAIIKNDLSEKETIDLTDIFIKSGKTINLEEIKGSVVDKHSTGGVGDKTTLVVTAIVAASESKVAKMSGKALGFTGGTIDKLNSIPGFNTNLTKKQFISQINKIGVAISSQTEDLDPADKKIYNLRDKTNTVNNRGLIASSIMSKKIASGANSIVLDVKVGNGAFMKTKEEAKVLSELMVKIAKNFKRKAIAVLTDMNEPLGYAVGNSLEVQEAIETLKNKGERRFAKLCIFLSSQMVAMDQDIVIEEATKKVKESLKSKKALKKFEQLIKAQGGNLKNLPKSKFIINYYPKKKGYINKINTEKIGKALNLLIKESDSKYSEGFVFRSKVGDYVSTNPILTIHTDNQNIDKVLDILNQSIIIKRKKITKEDIIIDIIK